MYASCSFCIGRGTARHDLQNLRKGWNRGGLLARSCFSGIVHALAAFFLCTTAEGGGRDFGRKANEESRIPSHVASGHSRNHFAGKWKSRALTSLYIASEDPDHAARSQIFNAEFGLTASFTSIMYYGRTPEELAASSSC